MTLDSKESPNHHNEKKPRVFTIKDLEPLIPVIYEVMVKTLKEKEIKE